ncbi:hypothetical protein [Halonatronum saccharophilum]|uniref:hypothetical protein n=1 Tax=Halonatronum saccharophilum TaxID=150060 RepID=UPI000486D8D9|nr:hypothetical protein [Halonatronum saccharophilum]
MSKNSFPTMLRVDKTIETKIEDSDNIFMPDVEIHEFISVDVEIIKDRSNSKLTGFDIKEHLQDLFNEILEHY